MAKRNISDGMPHGTVTRIGADDAIDVMVDGSHLATFQRGDGGRFRLHIAAKKPIAMKRRKKPRVGRK